MASQSHVGSSKYQNDPRWNYNFLINLVDRNSITCKFCQKVTIGGIFRAKMHQVGGKVCLKCSQETKGELKACYELKGKED